MFSCFIWWQILPILSIADIVAASNVTSQNWLFDRLLGYDPLRELVAIILIDFQVMRFSFRISDS